jgi:hypothetical protein
VVSITPRPRFTPGERAPCTHCIGGWVGPRAGPDAEGRGKILCFCRGSEPGRPAPTTGTKFKFTYKIFVRIADTTFQAYHLSTSEYTHLIHFIHSPQRTQTRNSPLSVRVQTDLSLLETWSYREKILTSGKEETRKE